METKLSSPSRMNKRPSDLSVLSNAPSEPVNPMKDLANFTFCSTLTCGFAYFTNLLNLLFVAKYGNLTDIARLGVARVYINTISKWFSEGFIDSFSITGAQYYNTSYYNSESFYKMFHTNKLLAFVFFILVTLPLGFTSNYVLSLTSFGTESVEMTTLFVRMSMVEELISLFGRSNEKMLEILGFYGLNGTFRVVSLIFNFMASSFYLDQMKLGLYGLALANIFSTFVHFCLTAYFVTEHSPFGDRSIVLTDTSCLDDNNKFYKIAELGCYKGLSNQFRGMFFDFTVFSSIGLGTKSLITSVIALEVTETIWSVITGMITPIRQKFTFFWFKSDEDREKHISKVFTYVIGAALIFTLLCSLSLFLLSDSLISILVYDKDIIGKLIYLSKFLSILILVDGLNTAVEATGIALKIQNTKEFIICLMSFCLFTPLGCLLAYVYNLDYFGIWISVFLNWVVLVVINLVFSDYIDFDKHVRFAIREHNNTVKKKENKLTSRFYRRNSIINN